CRRLSRHQCPHARVPVQGHDAGLVPEAAQVQQPGGQRNAVRGTDPSRARPLFVSQFIARFASEELTRYITVLVYSIIPIKPAKALLRRAIRPVFCACNNLLLAASQACVAKASVSTSRVHMNVSAVFR